MADDVGDGFANGEAEHGFFCGVRAGGNGDSQARSVTPAASRVLRASSISAGRPWER